MLDPSDLRMALSWSRCALIWAKKISDPLCLTSRVRSARVAFAGRTEHEEEAISRPKVMAFKGHTSGHKCKFSSEGFFTTYGILKHGQIDT